VPWVFLSVVFALARQRFHGFASQLVKRQPLADDHGNRQAEALPVIHALAVVEPKGLLIDVAEQVKRLDRNIGATERPLEQAPEILKPLGMNFAVHIRYCLVNHFVLNLVKAFIG
jgi:hypothetical protein